VGDGGEGERGKGGRKGTDKGEGWRGNGVLILAGFIWNSDSSTGMKENSHGSYTLHSHS